MTSVYIEHQATRYSSRNIHLVVASDAYQLELVPIQRDHMVVDVLRRQPLLMMDNMPGSQHISHM